MLTCVYHPIDGTRVVQSDEAEKMRATGVWFDCPNKAKAYRMRVEEDIKKEKAQKPKQKEKLNEKR